MSNKIKMKYLFKNALDKINSRDEIIENLGKQIAEVSWAHKMKKDKIKELTDIIAELKLEMEQIVAENIQNVELIVHQTAKIQELKNSLDDTNEKILVCCGDDREMLEQLDENRITLEGK